MDFRDLHVYKKGFQLAMEIYEISKGLALFPIYMQQCRGSLP